MYRSVVAVSTLVFALMFALRTQAATPSSGQAAIKVPQRWEYVTLFKADEQHWFMHVLKPTGTVETPLARPNSRQNPLELALAKLGAQGWELTGVVGTPDASSEVLYLKRPM